MWQKLAAIDVNGNVLRVIRNLYEKTKACVRVNGVYTNVFDCGIGVRQGDSLSPLLFIIFLNDFKNYIRNQFVGANLSTLRHFDINDQEETRTLLQMFVLLYADDTVLLTESAGDMQKALDATVRYCELNKMSLNIEKTKYIIFSRGKVRKIDDITIYDTPIERVDSFCYLGIVFRYNNTFQNAIKHNIDKEKQCSKSVFY